MTTANAAHNQAPAAERNPFKKAYDKLDTPLKKAGAIGMLAITLLVTREAIDMDTQSKVERALTPDKTVTGTQVPGFVTKPAISPETNSQSIDTVREEQVNEGTQILEGLRNDSITELQNMGYNVNPGKVSDDNTNQEIADQFTVNIYSTWRLAKTDTSKAEEALEAIINPNGAADDDFERYKENLHIDGQGLITATSQVGDWTKNFYNNSYKDVPSNGNAMRVLTSIYTDGTGSQNTFRRDTRTGGLWSLEKMVPADMEEHDYEPDLREIDKIVS